MFPSKTSIASVALIASLIAAGCGSDDPVADASTDTEMELVDDAAMPGDDMDDADMAEGDDHDHEHEEGVIEHAELLHKARVYLRLRQGAVGRSEERGAQVEVVLGELEVEERRGGQDVRDSRTQRVQPTTTNPTRVAQEGSRPAGKQVPPTAAPFSRVSRGCGHRPAGRTEAG